MNEKEVMKANLKLSVFNSFPYKRLKQVCDAIVDLGFGCEFVDNGNVVFTDNGYMSIEAKMRRLAEQADAECVEGEHGN